MEKESQLFALSILRIQRQSSTIAIAYLDPSMRQNEIVVGWAAIKSTLPEEMLTKLTYPSSDLPDGMAWCHSCRQFKEVERTKTCSYRGKIGSNSSLGAISNPYLHLYIMYKTDIDDNSHNYFYPYLQYRNQGLEEVCDRIYCSSCLEHLKLESEQFLCPYCLGVCMCERCALSDSIAKYQSQFINAGGTFSELK